jgi:hypothetical protein
VGARRSVLSPCIASPNPRLPGSSWAILMAVLCDFGVQNKDTVAFYALPCRIRTTIKDPGYRAVGIPVDFLNAALLRAHDEALVGHGYECAPLSLLPLSEEHGHLMPDPGLWYLLLQRSSLGRMLCHTLPDRGDRSP